MVKVLIKLVTPYIYKTSNYINIPIFYKFILKKHYVLAILSTTHIQYINILVSVY